MTKRGNGLTALVWFGAALSACGGWTDLESPETGGSGGTTSGGVAATGGKSTTSVPPAGGKSSGTVGGTTGIGHAGDSQEPPEPNGVGGEPLGEGGAATAPDSRLFELLTGAAPHLVPPGADGPGITYTASAVVDTGSLEHGVLAGGIEYCFKKPQTPFSCDFQSREPFVWKEASGLVALDRLNVGGLAFFPSFVSDDGDTVVGAYNTGDSFGGFFRWTKAGGATSLGEPEGTGSGTPYDMSSDGKAIVGMAKVDGKDKLDHANFLWTEPGGYPALADEATWPAEAEVVSISADGLTLLGQTPNSTDTHMAFRWTKAGGAESLGSLPGRTHCSIGSSTANAEVIFGICEDDQQVGRGFRWTEATGMKELNNASNSCLMGGVSSLNTEGTVAFGSVECGDQVYAPGRWALGAGASQLPAAPSNLHFDYSITGSGNGKIAFGLLVPPSDGGFPFSEGTPGTEAYRYSAGGTVEPLPPPSGADFTSASAIDALGLVIVGRSGSQGARSRAVLWDSSERLDIMSYLTAHGVDLNGLELTHSERVAVIDDTIVIQGFISEQNRGGAWVARIPLVR